MTTSASIIAPATEATTADNNKWRQLQHRKSSRIIPLGWTIKLMLKTVARLACLTLAPGLQYYRSHSSKSDGRYVLLFLYGGYEVKNVEKVHILKYLYISSKSTSCYQYFSKVIANLKNRPNTYDRFGVIICIQ